MKNAVSAQGPDWLYGPSCATDLVVLSRSPEADISPSDADAETELRYSVTLDTYSWSGA